jgi:hypothetical protein
MLIDASIGERRFYRGIFAPVGPLVPLAALRQRPALLAAISRPTSRSARQAIYKKSNIA